VPEQPKLIELQDPGSYVLPDMRAYVGLLVGGDDTRPARIRLRVLNSTTVDIPLSPEALRVLAADLRSYLPKQ
jgi:hypothetical protein